MSETEIDAQVQKPKTSRLAIWSMVLGIFGFLSQYLIIIPLFLCSTSLIFGIVALRKINKSSGLLKGKGFAITALVIAALGFSVPTSRLVYYIKFMKGSKIVKIDDVTSRTKLMLSNDDDAISVDTIRLLITGDIDGSATIHLCYKEKREYTYPIDRGKVHLWILEGWYDNDCLIEYEPLDVRSGSLTIRYFFRGIQRYDEQKQ